MTRLLPLALVLALALGAAPTADAQLGRLLDRARDAVSGTAERASDAAAQAAGLPTGSAMPDDPSPATLDGRPAPVMDYFSMMRTGYVLPSGYWSDGTHFVLFQPDGRGDAEWTVTDGDGRVLFTEESRLTRTGDATFNNIRAPRFMSLDNSGFTPGDGDFALNMIVDGRLVGHIPYTVQTVQAGDAYSPRTEYRRVDGPWAKLAMFTYWLREPDEAIEFHGWVTASDLDGDDKVRVTLYRDGEPVATCHARDCPRARTDRADWAYVKTQLVHYASRDERRLDTDDWFDIANVTPGAYEVRVTGFESGTPVRRYALTGADGAFQEHPRSAMSYEPRYDHLSPRTVRITGGGSGSLKFNQTFWMEAVE